LCETVSKHQPKQHLPEICACTTHTHTHTSRSGHLKSTESNSHITSRQNLSLQSGS